MNSLVAWAILTVCKGDDTERKLIDQLSTSKSRKYYYGGGEYGAFRDEVIKFTKSDKASGGYASLRILKKYIMVGDTLILKGINESDITLSCFRIEGYLLKTRRKGERAEPVWTLLAKSRIPFQRMFDDFTSNEQKALPVAFANWRASALDILKKNLQ